MALESVRFQDDKDLQSTTHIDTDCKIANSMHEEKKIQKMCGFLLMAEEGFRGRMDRKALH